MPDSQANLKIFTLEDANALLPQVRQAIVALRKYVALVLTQEAHVDARELIADHAPSRLANEMALLEQRKAELQRAVEAFERLGCHLKDLDLGLVDFYTWMDGELVLLCWREDEEQIRHWHTVEDGYPGRQPIPGT